MSLRWQLLGGFGIVCVVMAIVGWLGVNTAQGIQANLTEVGADTMPSIVALAETQENLLLGQRSIRSAILATDPTVIKGYIDVGRKGLDNSDRAFKEYLALPMADEEKQLGVPLAAALKAYRAFFDQAAQEATTNTTESKAQATDVMLKQAATPAAVLGTNLPQLAIINENQGSGLVLQAQYLFDRSLRILIGVLAAGLLGSLGIGFYLARSVDQGTARAATGLDQSVPPTRKGNLPCEI